MRQLWKKVLAVLILSATAASAQAQFQSGYTVLTPDNGTARPTGAVLFSYSNSDGVLVSQAGVGASEPMRSGRTFVDNRSASTGLAIVNLSAEDASVTLTLRDGSGNELDRFTLPPLGGHQHIARFVSELFSIPSANVTGSLTFESTTALAAIALRQTNNAQGEPLYTTLPVADLGAPANSEPVVFPQIAVGGGYTTQVLLMNRSAQTLRGRVDFVGSDGRPMLVRLESSTIVSLPYEIPPQGTYLADLNGDADVAAGYGLVTPDSGSNTPSGTAIFRVTSGGALLTEAAVAATAPTTAARIYVDNIGTKTGIALANPGDQPADLKLTLMDRFGVIEKSLQQRLPARSQVATFVDELFPIADGYSGLLEVLSSRAVAPIALKLTKNARGDSVLTTLPVADLRAPAVNGMVVFPHVAIGDGFSTRLILINTNDSTPALGQVDFYRSDGTPMIVPIPGQTGSASRYQIVPGGGRQLYPGNTEQVARISLVGSELVINEGNRVHPALRIVDSKNTPRDDFDAAILSLDPAIAEIDAFGTVFGKKPGFSTLRITAGGKELLVTATVVGVNSGGAGYHPVSVVQDSAGRLYMASETEHIVLKAENLNQIPQPYAGVSNSSGFKDDSRLQALFNGPSFLAKNQGTEKSLYVSDGANNAIRKIGDARVETLAGGHGAGSADGPVADAAFSNPRGVALDSRGYLWVADSGNHTIRRINLVTLTVETIAGSAGMPGSADGIRSAARFNSPSGIAVEVETPAQELQRAIRGEGPPPVSIIVADTGNGLVRRVKDTGEVETITTVQNIAAASSQRDKSGLVSAATTTTSAMFAAPFAVAVDATGNIFVTEREASSVKALLRTGEIVPAAQPGTLGRPAGIVVARDGKVVVAGADQGAIELSYGQPQIGRVEPPQWSSRGGQLITVKGSNFAPDTLVIVAGVVVDNRSIVDTQTVTFIAPVLVSGRQTLSILNRGGLAQFSVTVDPVPLRELPVGYVTTVAGGSTFAGEGSPATAVPVGPSGITVDSQGNIFFSDGANRKVRRVDVRTGILTTVAGTGQDGPDGNGGPAIAAGFSSYLGSVAFDSSGNLLIADGNIRKVDAVTGKITPIVGGMYGFCDDDDNNAPALQAAFNYIIGFAVDAEGNIFIADRFNHRIRRMDARTMRIKTIAGNCKEDFSGDGGLATEASFDNPSAVALDEVRKVLYIADAENDRVRRIDLQTNIITTVASESNGLSLAYPNGLALDSAGDLYISDRGHSRILKLEIATGALRIVAGSGEIGSGGDGGPATSAALQDPVGLAVDAAGNIFIADSSASVVRRVDAVTRIITTFAGNREAGILDDNGPATAATLRYPVSVTADSSGNIYINDNGNARIRKLDGGTGVITTIAGGGKPETGNGDGGPATKASAAPTGRVAVDQDGNLYFAERYGYRIRKIDHVTNTISTIAGNGADKSLRDVGWSLDVAVFPDDVAVDWNGNLYFAESDKRRVRRLNLSTFYVDTVAGGDGTLGDSLRIAVHPDGNLFIADLGNGVVRKIDATTGEMTIVAGGGPRGSFEENRRATLVDLDPVTVDVDQAGNLYICAFYSILKVSAETGFVRTIAAAHAQGFQLGDNGPANDAFFYYAQSVTVDSSGNLYIADSNNDRVRAIRGPLP